MLMKTKNELLQKLHFQRAFEDKFCSSIFDFVLSHYIVGEQ